jgi:hypothetical protein|tara:strand:+ start:218 stop:454 length:237 start_codon:yes stop_codon:yes gene_type:complete
MMEHLIIEVVVVVVQAVSAKMVLPQVEETQGLEEIIQLGLPLRLQVIVVIMQVVVLLVLTMVLVLVEQVVQKQQVVVV